MKKKRRPYLITFLPDPVCWTDAPENLHDLKGQRVRWQHGLGQALMMNRSLIFNPKGGTVSWLAIPFYMVFELFGPILEVLGLLFILLCGWMGWLGWPESAIYFGLAIGLGILLSTSAIMLEEMSFHMYPRVRELLLLYFIAVVENFGFRQLTAIWRLQGLIRWLGGRKHKWQTITRSSSLADK